MEKARCNTELYSNLRGPLNNVKPSNFWGSHQASQCGGAVNLSNSDYTSYAKASMSTWAVRMRKNIVKGYTVVYATEGASLPATLLL